MPELDILRNALTAFDNMEALQHLRSHAPQIRQALERQELDLDAGDSRALAAHPEWLASVYAALGSDAQQEEVDCMQRELDAILASEQEAIADAWAALLERLDAMHRPGEPGRWELPLKAAGEPELALIRHLRASHPSCRRGDPAAERLLRYGLSPGMLFDALRGMELLFNRALRRGTVAPAAAKGAQRAIRLQDGNKSATITPALLHAELAGALDLTPGMAQPLARSLACMLEAAPLLVSGYRYLGGHTFRKLEEKAQPPGFLRADNLMCRWCLTDREVEHAVAAL